MILIRCFIVELVFYLIKVILKNCYFDIIRKISKDMSETSRFIYLI